MVKDGLHPLLVGSRKSHCGRCLIQDLLGGGPVVMFVSGVRPSPAQQADRFMHDLHRIRGNGVASPSQSGPTIPFSPPCRLHLDGGENPETSCEILELSAEGVSIAISGGGPVHKGQHGRLLIGPPEGDHYELPVDVSWVEPAASIAVLGLAIPSARRWTFSRR